MNQSTNIVQSPIHPADMVSKPCRRFIRIEKMGPAFWTTASILSLVINLVLLAVVIGLASQLFSLKQVLNNQLIGGLYNNFVLMDQANIRTTIPVNTTVPAKFNLPLKTDTIVTLTQDTSVKSAYVTLYGGVVNINQAPTDIILPAGTKLPVHLELSVPVDQKIPVDLVVNVDIPLNQTELHKPFVGLQSVLSPYYAMLNETPDSWAEVFCDQPYSDLCNTLFP